MKVVWVNTNKDTSHDTIFSDLMTDTSTNLATFQHLSFDSRLDFNMISSVKVLINIDLSSCYVLD
jgi:hypothetical protein